MLHKQMHRLATFEEECCAGADGEVCVGERDHRGVDVDAEVVEGPTACRQAPTRTTPQRPRGSLRPSVRRERRARRAQTPRV